MDKNSKESRLQNLNFIILISALKIFWRILGKSAQSDLFGKAFEHFIALELRAYISYRRKFLSLSYWQAQNGQEVDFVVGDTLAIEVKATDHVQDKHLKGLLALAEEKFVSDIFW